MAKKVKAIVKLQIPAGKANPAPPVGTALGPHQINIMAFCKEYNARTQNMMGSIIPAEITSGKGDFMVTTESSVLPWSAEHYDVAANHMSVSWNKKVIDKTIELLEGI